MGFLRARSLFAHCTHVSDSDLSFLASKNVSIAHCPLSNQYFSSRPLRLREILSTHSGTKVGLGCDIAGGYSISLLQNVRQAILVSRSRGDPTLRIDWKEALWLATRGGALALDLPNVGTFEEGQLFDAQLIHITPESGSRVDLFEGVERGRERDPFEELVEKWVSNGDDRDRAAVWCAGQKIYSRASS